MYIRDSYFSAVEILAIADEGIEQVFTTSAYNEWDYALQAFEEAGDQEYPKFLRAVAQLFGPGGPPAVSYTHLDVYKRQ